TGVGVSGPLGARLAPPIRFLFIGSCVCYTLPSDPTSRWTPLRFATLPLHQGVKRLSLPSFHKMLGAPLLATGQWLPMARRHRVLGRMSEPRYQGNLSFATV